MSASTMVPGGQLPEGILLLFFNTVVLATLIVVTVVVSVFSSEIVEMVVFVKLVVVKLPGVSVEKRQTLRVFRTITKSKKENSFLQVKNMHS